MKHYKNVVPDKLSCSVSSNMVTGEVKYLLNTLKRCSICMRLEGWKLYPKQSWICRGIWKDSLKLNETLCAICCSMISSMILKSFSREGESLGDKFDALILCNAFHVSHYCFFYNYVNIVAILSEWAVDKSSMSPITEHTIFFFYLCSHFLVIG